MKSKGFDIAQEDLQHSDGSSMLSIQNRNRRTDRSSVSIEPAIDHTVPSNILVFNCGSSSLTYKIFEVDNEGISKTILAGKANRVGGKGSEPSFIETQYKGTAKRVEVPLKNHRMAADLALQHIRDQNIKIDFIGHRFVHGGDVFQKSVLIDMNALTALKSCQSLAPIHNPNSLSVIGECRKQLPAVPQYVAFDTAFHSTIPSYAYTYALPKRINKKFGFRKYGFHGLSYSFIVTEVSRFLNMSLADLKIVACHLGTGGSSVAAIKGGRSVDTSMGYTPLSGLVMSTRCGDIDPMLAVYLMSVYGYRVDEVMELFNKKSGLLGVSGFSSDIRDIVRRVTGDERQQANLAFKMYIHRLRKYIGEYVVVLEGMDVLVFTDDIGVHNWQVRESVCRGMDYFGLQLDDDANQRCTGDEISLLSTPASRVRILSVPTQEERVICLEVINLLGATNEITL